MIRKLLEILRESPRKISSRIFLALAITLGMSGLNLMIPVLFKTLIEVLPKEEASRIPWVGVILVGYGACFVTSHLMTLFRSLVIFKVAEDCFRTVSLELLRHLLSLPYAFHLNKKSGGVGSDVSRLQPALESLLWGVFFTLIPVCIEVTIITAIIGSIYGLIWGLGLVGLFAAYGVIYYLGAPFSKRANESYYAKRSFASGKVMESLLHFETIKAFTNEEKELKQINQAYEEQRAAGIKRARVDLLLQLAQTVLIGFTFISITWVSGRAVYKQNMPIGSFILVNGYLLQLVMPLNYLGHVISQIRKGVQDIRGVFQLLLTRSEESRRGRNQVLESIRIDFQEVGFGYLEKKPVLHDLSFTILPGTKTAIVGATGSGKSTIAKLLLQFYDLKKGQILINGLDISQFNLKQLRGAIALVSQDTSLFNESLYYNIAYGNPTATKKQVEEAITMADLDHFIDALPNGYKTEVGERGMKLSGGEKQRVAIARAILKKPLLYIFDEATSSLDSLTEEKIQASIDKVSSGVTTIVIAHRLSTVRNADQIILLNEGRIQECGAHEDLMAKKELYSRFSTAQNSSGRTL